ncbi:MAG: hypothetical protein ACRDPC_23900 [Solirubrobacteraceae bacterium]
MLNPDPVTTTPLDESRQEVIQHAVTSREPDRDVADEDLAFWLALQERLEIRADLAAHGLL